MSSKWNQSRTIVEYSVAEPAFNGYPKRIVSPPRASSCCLEEMLPVGRIHWDDLMPFIYKRCASCGHTVRHFLEDTSTTPREH